MWKSLPTRYYLCASKCVRPLLPPPSLSPSLPAARRTIDYRPVFAFALNQTETSSSQLGCIRFDLVGRASSSSCRNQLELI
jgi:hypothetical protein